MSLIATFTIVVSTISSNAQKIAVIVMMTRREPYSTNDSICCMIFDYLMWTSTFTFIPGLNCLTKESAVLLNSIFTGSFCTTFTKLPLALSGGNSANVEPVA